MNKLILCGPGAAGKDFIRKKFQKKGWKYGITYTTRPKRHDEIEGEDYHFILEAEFRQKIQEDFFVEFDLYRGWYYGTPITEWERCNLFTMTPSGIKQVKMNIGLDTTFVLYVNADLEIRRKRLSERKDADDPERRIKTDNEDFKNFTLFDFEIK